MAARDPEESHRAATPLELLFDLCVVVAVAQSAAGLHHGLSHGHGTAVLGFAMVFFAVWWAWMNFTWFASAYDPDDVPYRLLVLVQIAGVLVIAAGVPRGLERQDFDVVTLGYAIMRVGLIALWLRAAAADPARRSTGLRYAAGIALCQAGWLAVLLLPPAQRLPAFPVLVVAELLVPIFAERAAATRWHPHHIAERYGLLTLIVLGESVLAATLAIQAAVDAGGLDAELVGVIVGSLVTVFSMWWIYFDDDTAGAHLGRTGSASFAWGYGHFVLFAAAAATGAGIAVMVDHVSGQAHLPGWQAGAALAVPVALYVLAVWLIHIRPRCPSRWVARAYPVAACAIGAAALTPAPPIAIGLILAGLAAATTAGGAGHAAAAKRGRTSA